MPYTAPDDERVMSLVGMALACPREGREAYLKSVCAGDSELFEQVWSYVEAEERMKGFLLEPLVPRHFLEHPFGPGELLAGRFRIAREVAQGGMGIVYEAMDEKLERRIALKCAKAGFGKRLPPEVRNATEISHPNVCKIFEIHTASTQGGETEFLTMEFLDGQTLAQRLHSGAPPIEEARTIALQLCAGLAEAHRNGVIHGDLKSNNVILTTDGAGAIRAVITDFGLAHGAGTLSGGPGGTPDYMAPELYMGRKATVASDIYALGVVLYELVTGRAAEGAKERLAVHPKWDGILHRCLDPDPARRFADADAVALAIAPPRTRRWFLGSAAAAALAAVTGEVMYRRGMAPPESVRLAALPFDAAEETLMRGVADRLRLLKGNQHTAIETVPMEKVLRAHVDSAQKAGRALGVTHVLRGSVERTSGEITLAAFVTDARSGVDVKEFSANYAEREERYIPVVVTSMVTDAFHLTPIATGPAVSAAARADYLAGLGLLRRDSTVAAARAAFERAVQADPDSALAYAGLSEAQWFENFFSKQQVWMERSRESAREAARRNMDLAPVHRVTGLHLEDAGFYEQASAEYRRAVELDPRDAENYRRLGQIYEKNNQREDALAWFQNAVAVEPGYYRARRELGAYYYNRGDYTKAVAPLEEAVRLAPREPHVRFGLGTTYMNLGMYAQAEEQLRRAIDLDDTTSALHSLGVTLMYEGRDREAVPWFARALRRDPESYLSWMYLGIAYRRTRRTAESAEANRRGKEAVEADVARHPRNGYMHAIRGYFGAVLGDRERAKSETTQALILAADDAETRGMAILTYEAMHERSVSIELLNRCPRLQLLDISRWPDLADLAHDSRFLQLLDLKSKQER